MELTPENYAITHPAPSELVAKDIANVQGQVDRHNSDVITAFRNEVNCDVFNGYPRDFAIHQQLQNFDIADLMKVEFRPDGSPTGAMVSAGRYAPPGYVAVQRVAKV